MSKVIEYRLKVKNDAKAGLNEARQDFKQFVNQAKTDIADVPGVMRRGFAGVAESARDLLRLVPGGGLVQKMLGAGASSIVGGVAAAFAGVLKISQSVSDHWRTMSDIIDDLSISVDRWREKAFIQIKIAGDASALDSVLENAKSKMDELRDKEGQLIKDLNGQSFAGALWSPLVRREKKNELEMVQQGIRTTAGVQRAAEEKLPGQRAADAEKLAAANQARIDAERKEIERERTNIKLGRIDPLKGLDERGLMSLKKDTEGKIKAILEATAANNTTGNVEREGVVASAMPATKESNDALRRLYETADKAADALKKIEDQKKEDRKKDVELFWQKQDEIADKEKDLRSRLRGERLEQLTPERQLAIRRAEYRAVVTEGRNTADPEKKLELANRAMELRGIMRPLIASLAAGASVAEVGEEAAGGMSGGGMGRVRRGPIGLGRLSGNRAGYRFGRILSSQFDGAGLSGGGSSPAKRPIEDIGEEQLRVLKNIEAKTGFGKGG